MKRDLPDADKAVFKAAAERRLKAGIRLKRVCITMSEKQVADFYTVFDALVEMVGKQEAVNGLILMTSRAVAKLKDKERADARLHS